MRPAARAEKQASQQMLFLPSVFNETLTLLFDAHHYFQSRGAEDHATIGKEYQRLYTTEMSRVTVRLTSIMAWIMVRRAVTAGEIDEEKAAESYRLDTTDMSLTAPEGITDMLPYYFWHLSERSQGLYERVARLDEMVYGTRH